MTEIIAKGHEIRLPDAWVHHGSYTQFSPCAHALVGYRMDGRCPICTQILQEVLRAIKLSGCTWCGVTVPFWNGSQWVHYLSEGSEPQHYSIQRHSICMGNVALSGLAGRFHLHNTGLQFWINEVWSR